MYKKLSTKEARVPLTFSVGDLHNDPLEALAVDNAYGWVSSEGLGAILEDLVINGCVTCLKICTVW